MILLDHIIRCRGEGIKVLVSDNAAVGKNWLTTVALPQYIVDQGLADVVVIVYLENNHGKWLADMLFGQLQTRRKRTTILGIDSLLTAFESINRKSGSIHGFAVNSLSCVDFSEIFGSLGYETTPPKDFGFVKRNIHFSVACSYGAQNRLPVALRNLLGDLLPSEPGMVRVCSDPPGEFRQSELPYERRFTDVPAVALGSLGSVGVSDSTGPPFAEAAAPLVVPMDRSYAPSGPGVVSHRNMEHVGYNGIEFRKLNACPELSNDSEPLVMQAWPVGLLGKDRYHLSGGSEELVSGFESMKCAPENWVLRRPVARFNLDGQPPRARYPPRNMLNAKYKKPPRNPIALEPDQRWIPTTTYSEPPFPLLPRTSAFSALGELQESHASLSETINVLDILRCVYKAMGDRQNVGDPWLQRRVTIPSASSVDKYRNEISVYKRRESGHPSAPITVRQAFKNDPVVAEKVASMRLEESTKDSTSASRESDAKARTRLTSKLFEEATLRPGGLEKYRRLVERDLERYAGELKVFKEVTQVKFDEENGLLPLPASRGSVDVGTL